MARRGKQRRIWGKILFVLYIGFIIYFLIFSDWYGRAGATDTYRYNLTLFQEIRRFWNYREQLGWYAVFTNLVGNVVIFLPFGFFLAMASKYHSVFSSIFYSFLLSFGVETFQFFTRVGSFDVDDMFLNTLGGALGCVIYVICAAIRRRYEYNRKK